MALFGAIFARVKYRPLSSVTIRHEEIHKVQAHECGGWWRFYWKYLRYWMKYGYKNIPFEKDAYKYASLSNTERRPVKAWEQFE